MGGVVFVHSDPKFREAFGVALRIRGIDVEAYERVQDALSEMAKRKPIAFLVEPRLLFREAEELAPRVAKIAGRPVRIVALTNAPSAEEKSFFKRHGAGTLAGPVEDIERIVSSLEKLVASGGATDAPWDQGRPMSAPWESERRSAPWEGEKDGPPPRIEKVGPIPKIEPKRQVEKVTLPEPPEPPASRLVEKVSLPTPNRAESASRGGADEDWLFGDTSDFQLPMPTVPPSATAAAATLRGRDDAQLAREGQGPAILVVDDDPAFRFFLCEALAEKKYRVFISINGPNALRFLKSEPTIALVVSEVNMAHMDGFELKHEADKATGRTIPYVVVTADTNPEKLEIARKVGVSGIMQKPLRDLDDFYALVEAALKGETRGF